MREINRTTIVILIFIIGIASINFISAANFPLYANENKIFAGKEKEMVFTLSVISREILDLKQMLSPNKDVLESLHKDSRNLFGDEFKSFTHQLLETFYKIEHSLKSNQEYIDELRLTNNSLLSTKETETIKTLTIMAFITFPLSLIVAIFDMKTTYVPIIGMKNDFWIILGIMFSLTFLFFLFFKYKKWL